MLNQLVGSVKSPSALMDCLLVIAAKLKVEVAWPPYFNENPIGLNDVIRHQDRLGMMVCPADPLANHSLPLLLCDESTGHFYVKFPGNSSLYDATLKRFVKMTPYQPIKFRAAWLISPVYSRLPRGYLEVCSFGCKKYFRELALILLLGLIVSLMTLSLPVMTGFVFTHLTEFRRLDYVFFVGALGALIIASILIGLLSDFYIKSFNLKMIYHALPGLYFNLFKLPGSIVTSFQSGELLQRFLDYELVLMASMSATLSLFFSFCSLVVFFVYMFYLNVSISLLYSLVFLVVFVVKLACIPLCVRYLSRQLEVQGQMIQFLSESFMQIDKIRTACLEAIIFRRWLSSLVKLKSFSFQYLRLDMVLLALSASLPALLLMVLIFIIYCQSDRLGMVSLLQFLLCGGQLTMLFDKFCHELSSIIHFQPNFSRLREIISCHPSPHPLGHLSCEFRGDIDFINVSYQSILDHVSLSIKAGQFIGVVGPSGAGKSTLTRLLLGLADGYSGDILLDGVNIKLLDMSILRRQFGVVLQSSSLLPGTIYSNIAANIALTHDEAWELARCVGLDKDIETMPMKMQTFLSDNSGESLSGGQRQKLLIARALAAKPRILLLDEATSALDAFSQARIYDHLKGLGVTRVVIAHRYSTIREADKIYQVEKGRIISV